MAVVPALKSDVGCSFVEHTALSTWDRDSLENETALSSFKSLKLLKLWCVFYFPLTFLSTSIFTPFSHFYQLLLALGLKPFASENGLVCALNLNFKSSHFYGLIRKQPQEES